MAKAWGSFDGAETWTLSRPLSDWARVTCDDSGTRVISLGLFFANIRGPLPPIIGFLGSLTSLNFESNELSGSIPGEVGNLQNLEFLNLANNSLTGSIPSTIGRLTRLSVLKLSANQLGGSIPQELGSLSRLQLLYLYDNFLTGSVPSWIWRFTLLTELTLARNQLSGGSFGAVGNLLKLQYLDLERCGLSGSIPAEITRLVGLTFVGLSRNQLVGVLPSSLKMLSKAQYLYLDENQLTGKIPEFPNSLTEIYLSSNYFSSGSCSTLPWGALVSGNCLTSSGCSDQRSDQVCQQFCNTTLKAGACAGQGICSLDLSAGQAVCTCNANYAPSPANPGTCVPASSVTAAPPPPPPPQTGTITQGVAFTNMPMQSLNRWSRYLSLNFKYQNNVPSWGVNTVSAWMAPSDLFISSGSPESGTKPGVLYWPNARDQGSCASCWATVVADAMGASVTISSSQNGGGIVALSADQIRDCTTASGGCQGDFPTNALDYAIQNRVQPNNSYVASPVCPAKGSLAPQVIMYEAVQFRGWLGLLLTLQRQPAIVILQGSDPLFRQGSCLPKSGSFGNPDCYTGSLDHSVLVIGYDIIDLVPYWVIRNSWGPFWCLRGFMRISIQGGVGVCGMNILPAYYPISAPPLGDPCYTKSTIPDEDSQPALNPCGGGTCFPSRAFGPYGYTCTCPKTFVAVNNTVPVKLDQAELSITQTCVPVDACTFSEWSACGVGTCVNDKKGGYSCICPLGYFQSPLVDGSPTCSPGDDPAQTIRKYTVQGEVNCARIAATYNITQPNLKALNQALDCSQNLPVGSIIDISSADFQCQTPYITGRPGETCQAIADLLGFRSGVTGDMLQKLNVGSDCNNLLQAQLLCLQRGQWQRLQPCTTFFNASSSNPCEAIDKNKNLDPLSFFALNPGIICKPPGTVNAGASLDKPTVSVCIQSGSVGVTGKPPAGYTLISKKQGDTCTSLARQSRKTVANLDTTNKIHLNLPCTRMEMAKTGTKFYV